MRVDNTLTLSVCVGFMYRERREEYREIRGQTEEGGKVEKEGVREECLGGKNTPTKGDEVVWLRLIVAISSRHALHNNQSWDKDRRKLCSLHQRTHSCLSAQQVTHTLTNTTSYEQIPTPLSNLQGLLCSLTQCKHSRTESDDVTKSLAPAGHHIPPGEPDQSNLGHARGRTHTSAQWRMGCSKGYWRECTPLWQIAELSGMTEKAKQLPSSVHHLLSRPVFVKLLAGFPAPPLLSACASVVLDTCPPVSLVSHTPSPWISASSVPPHPRSLHPFPLPSCICRWMMVYILSGLILHWHRHTPTPHLFDCFQSTPFKSAPVSAWLPSGTLCTALICGTKTSEIPFGLLRVTYTCMQEGVNTHIKRCAKSPEKIKT